MRKQLFAITLGIMIFLCGCTAANSEKEKTSNTASDTQETEAQPAASDKEEIASTFNLNEQTIKIDGVTKEYRFIFVNDAHIIVNNEEVQPDYTDTVTQRYDSMMVSADGQHSYDTWKRLASELDSYDADAILFGGDIIDFMSQANIQTLKEDLDALKTPYMYVRADHDYGKRYTGFSSEEAQSLQESIDGYKKVTCLDYDDFQIIGINDTTSQMTQSTLDTIKEYFSNQKPTIIVMHVPINSTLNSDMAVASRENRNGETLLWGRTDDCHYVPDEITGQFIDLINSGDSPVVAVLSGHLHFPFISKLNDKTTQYVFDATYKGNIGVVTVSGS